MPIDTLLSLASKNGESTGLDSIQTAIMQVRRLQVQLQDFVDALASGDAQAINKHRSRATRLAAKFRLESFLAVLSEFPLWSRRKAGRLVEQAQESVGEFITSSAVTTPGLASIQRAQGALAELSQVLEQKHVRRAQGEWRRSWGLRSLALIAACAGGLATFYLGLQTGLAPVSTEVMLPHAPFRSTTPGVLSTTPEDLTGYFSEFSPYFFGHSDKFAAHYYPRPDLKPFGVSSSASESSKDAAPMAPAPTADPSALRNDPARARLTSHQSEPTDAYHPSGAHHLWRVILSNRSPYRGQFVGNVRVVVRLKRHREFPWHLLNVTPDLCVHREPSALRLINRGMGPALDVALTLRTRNGLVLREGIDRIVQRESPTHAYLDPAFQDPKTPVNSWPVAIEASEQDVAPLASAPTESDAAVDDSSDDPAVMDPANGEAEVTSNLAKPRLAQPLYLRLVNTPENAAHDADLISHEGTWYEVVSTVERLAAVTRTEYRSPVLLRAVYASLSGKQYELYYAHELPEDVVYYVRRTDLLERHPGEPQTYTVTHPVPENTVRSILSRTATAVALPPYQPRGVDLLVEAAELEVENLAVGESASQTIEVNQYLNAAGQLVVYLSVIEPQHARYHAEILLNGEVVHEFDIDTFVPPVLRFSGSPEEVKHFRAILTPSTPPSP